MTQPERDAALASQQRYEEAKTRLRDALRDLRICHIRFVNQTNPPRPLRRQFLELRWAATDALSEQLRSANELLRYLPVSEAAQLMATEVQRRVATDWLDEDTYDASSLLLQLNQQELSLFQASARSAVVLGTV